MYELWDTGTGNAIGEFATEAEALALVRSLVTANSLGYADNLALVLERDKAPVVVLEGRQLAAKAGAVRPKSTRLSA